MPLEAIEKPINSCKSSHEERRKEIGRRLGVNVRRVRQELPGNVTSADLARAIGANCGTVRHIENGTRGLSLELAWSLAYALGTDLNSLIGMEPINPPKPNPKAKKVRNKKT